VDGVLQGSRRPHAGPHAGSAERFYARRVIGSLPDDPELIADLKAVDYGYDASDAILLERKDDMRRRGLASPDDGDTLALTFAYPVAKKDWAEERRFEEGLQRLKRWIR
jgi:hypothetical protein